eukprot:gene9199-biopygen6719
MSRDSLATFPQPQTPLKALLKALYRAPELQFLLVLHTAGYTQTDGQTDTACPSVRPSVCHPQCVTPTGTAVLVPCRRIAGVRIVGMPRDSLATVSLHPRDSLATV